MGTKWVIVTLSFRTSAEEEISQNHAFKAAKLQTLLIEIEFDFTKNVQVQFELKFFIFIFVSWSLIILPRVC